MNNLSSIDFRLTDRLRSPEFRREWFRAQLEYGVPEQFRALREERGLTQTTLSEMTGMKQSAISRFEKSSDANWNLETLLTLASALDAQLEINLIKSEDVLSRMAASVGDGASSILAEQASREQFQEIGTLWATMSAFTGAVARQGLTDKGSLLWKSSDTMARA